MAAPDSRAGKHARVASVALPATGTERRRRKAEAERLFTAVASNDFAQVTQLLLAGAEPTAVNTQRETTLHWAAFHGATETCALLLERNVDPQARDVRGRTPLHCAACSGHAETASLLLEYSAAAVDAADREGMTAAHVALSGSETGHLDVLERLLAHDADMRAVDVQGMTPLHYAAYFGHAPSVRLILDRIPPERVRDVVGRANRQQRTALLDAVRKGHEHVALHLLLAGADATRKDAAQTSALHHAAGRGFLAFLHGARGLLPYTDVDSRGRTVLHRAAVGGHVDVVRMLLEHGASVEAVDKRGCSALHAALETESCPEALVRLLIDASQPSLLGVHSLAGRSVLHSAVVGGHGAAVALLLAAGSDPLEVDAKGADSLFLAASHGQAALIEPIARAAAARRADVPESDIWRGRVLNALVVAASSGHSDCLHRLLSPVVGGLAYRELVGQPDGEGRTALHGACFNGCLEAARFLLDLRADVDAVDGEGETPLLNAAFNGHSAVVSLLARHGAKVDAVDNLSRSALHWAAYNGHDKCAMTLLDLLDDSPLINAMDSNGFRPVHDAVCGGHSICASVLIRRGADVNARDLMGRTPLHHACLVGRREVVALLLARGADVSQRDRDSKLAVNLADDLGHSKIVSLVLRHETDQSRERNAMTKRRPTPVTPPASRRANFFRSNDLSISMDDVHKATPYSKPVSADERRREYELMTSNTRRRLPTRSVANRASRRLALVLVACACVMAGAFVLLYSPEEELH